MEEEVSGKKTSQRRLEQAKRNDSPNYGRMMNDLGQRIMRGKPNAAMQRRYQKRGRR